jgi:hypothetical protein
MLLIYSINLVKLSLIDTNTTATNIYGWREYYFRTECVLTKIMELYVKYIYIILFVYKRYLYDALLS